MTAEEFLKEDLKDVVIKPEGVKISDVMESYASHVLQEYKKELAEWVEKHKDHRPVDRWDEGFNVGIGEVLTKLKEE